MEHNESFVIKGVLAFPHLAEMDENDKYSLQIGNLSEAAVEKLESVGVDVKYKDDDKYGRGFFITSTSKYPFKPVDADGLPLDGSTIGYGSVVRAKVSTYDWKYKQKSGVGVRVIHLVIDELVEPETAKVDSAEMEDAL